MFHKSNISTIISRSHKEYIRFMRKLIEFIPLNCLTDTLKILSEYESEINNTDLQNNLEFIFENWKKPNFFFLFAGNPFKSILNRNFLIDNSNLIFEEDQIEFRFEKIAKTLNNISIHQKKRMKKKTKKERNHTQRIKKHSKIPKNEISASTNCKECDSELINNIASGELICGNCGLINEKYLLTAYNDYEKAKIDNCEALWGMQKKYLSKKKTQYHNEAKFQKNKLNLKEKKPSCSFLEEVFVRQEKFITFFEKNLDGNEFIIAAYKNFFFHVMGLNVVDSNRRTVPLKFKYHYETGVRCIKEMKKAKPGIFKNKKISFSVKVIFLVSCVLENDFPLQKSKLFFDSDLEINNIKKNIENYCFLLNVNFNHVWNRILEYLKPGTEIDGEKVIKLTCSLFKLNNMPQELLQTCSSIFFSDFKFSLSVESFELFIALLYELCRNLRFNSLNLRNKFPKITLVDILENINNINNINKDIKINPLKVYRKRYKDKFNKLFNQFSLLILIKLSDRFLGKYNKINNDKKEIVKSFLKYNRNENIYRQILNVQNALELLSHMHYLSHNHPISPPIAV